MKRILTNLILAACVLLMASCEQTVRVTGYSDDVPQLVPDYADVTVPRNIAPLSFGVEGLDRAALIIAGAHDSLCLTTSDGCFNPPVRAWHELLAKAQGQTLRLTVCRPVDGGWEAMRPVALHVSADPIDPYLVYRRVTPGYGLWNRMGLYERCLETYDERALYENRYGRGNCVNCHSFAEGDPDRWQVHVRFRQAGTYIFDGASQHKLQLQDASHGKPVYANWHPDGRLVAYSTNKTFFLIHTTHRNRWEVMDEQSDVMVTDVETGASYRSPLTAGEGTLETWPCFSPDGRWLYFCSAEMPGGDATQLGDDARVIAQYDSVRYSLCRIAFDATTRTFGEQVDTLFNAHREHASASLPRVSPDGRWLCFTRAAYGNFSICHRDADLCLLSLEDFDRAQSSTNAATAGTTARVIPLTAANSPEHVDSWHAWSRNSRWLVFSSKRDDGIHTRPFFVHIDAEGRAAKPFVLPIEDAPSAYDLDMECYNLPELVTGPVRGTLRPTGDSGGGGTVSGVN